MSLENVLWIVLFILPFVGSVVWLLRRLGEAEGRVRGLQEENTQLRIQMAQAEAQLGDVQRSSQEKVQALTQLHQLFRETFQALSAEALKENTQSFIALAKASLEKYHVSAQGDLKNRQEAITALVAPLKETLDKVGTTLGTMEKERASAYGGLTEQLKQLAGMSGQLKDETANLVKALRQPSVRGRWGEIQLRRVAEMAGMMEHCDFSCQVSSQQEAGVRRPDMVVRLPNQQLIVVDAKTPIQGYLDALEAPDEEMRRAKLADHARHVRTHIGQLASKTYWGQFQATPEFVVLFIPGETFFAAAVEQDPNLIEYGAEQRVMLATPTTLIALLRAVAYGWKQEVIAKNMTQVTELGKQLYERLRTCAKHFEDVGYSLGKSVESYNRAVATLETRVMVSARRFQEMGATTGEAIPELTAVEAQPREFAAE